MKKIPISLLITALLSTTIVSCGLSSNVKEANEELFEHTIDRKIPVDSCNHEHVLHYDKKVPTLRTPGHIEFYLCCDCYASFYDRNCQQQIENATYGVNNKLDGRYISPVTGVFSLLNENVKKYLSAKEDKDIINALRDYLPYNDQAERTIIWKDNNNGPYTVEVSHTRTFDVIESHVVEETHYVFDTTFVPGEIYYYRVKDMNNNYLLDDLSFKVDDTYPVRTMRIDGMNNVRDIGGWSIEGTNKVKYGMIYRGGNFNNISEKGKETLMGTLGVKTEIDLRTNGTRKIEDSRMSYNKCGMWQYTMIIPDYELWNGDYSGKIGFDEGSPASIKAIFELLADQNNYPVYYHCDAGADRTGTITYLINGLLGVSFEDLTKDFELTTYSIYGNRYRSDVNEETMTFTDSGTYGANLIAAWGKLNEVMQARYGQNNMPLSYAIENYLKTVCEISDSTIQAVKNNLITDVSPGLLESH